MYRIGCDVGGTNTDAALLDVTRLKDASKGVIATCKTPTTSNVTDGIKVAVQDVLTKSSIDHSKVLSVAIGTTHFVNAVVENDVRHLNRVAVVRLCGPYTRETPPFVDYPWALRELVEGPIYYLDGGLEIDGREICPINPEQIRSTARSIWEAGITAVVINGIFSALDHQNIQEERCRQIMLEVCPSLAVVCSRTIGGPGLLVRENAAILNASILSFARWTIAGFQKAILELDLRCPLFLTQNDGTLIEASLAADLPVKTFASGPTNSLMGAAFLQGVGDFSNTSNGQTLVVDVGGTTTDICALLPSGFPRKAPNFVEIGGVRTEFSMPDVYSVGLGGGSRVRFGDADHVSVGPDSVGHRLTSEALVFGGSTMTASDVVVATGIASMGNQQNVGSISQEMALSAVQEIRSILLKAVDKMKVSNDPVTILLVGGGSVIVPKDLQGVAQCLQPPFHDSANAIGAAIAKVAGDVDVIEIPEGRSENDILDRVKQAAIDAAIAKGADPYDVHIAEVTKLPLQYVNNKATRFVVKAVGSLSPHMTQSVTLAGTDAGFSAHAQLSNVEVNSARKASKPGSLATPSLGVDLSSYRPNIKDEVWEIAPIDVELIGIGCGILGTGGGGSSYDQSLYIYSLIHEGLEHPIRVVPPSSLADTDVCVFGAGFGAPSVGTERVDSGTNMFSAIDGLNQVLNVSHFHGHITGEIGGGNGLITFPQAAHYGRPSIDCDLMGRAFPTIEHTTPYLYDEPILPAAIADTKGNVGLVLAAESNAKIEAMLRTTCVELGNHVGVACRPLCGAAIQKYGVPNTLSQAWFLGRAVRIAQRTKLDFIRALQDVMPVTMIYEGKIIDVSRDVSKGYTVGRCVIGPLAADERIRSDRASVAESTTFDMREMVIPFQNEYLAAYLVNDARSETGQQKDFVCTVPDLISILGQDGEAIGSPELRYGLQVKVIAMPAHPLWTTPRGLRVGGPEFFHLNTEWVSIGQYQPPKSVFEVFKNIREAT